MKQMYKRRGKMCKRLLFMDERFFIHQEKGGSI